MTTSRSPLSRALLFVTSLAGLSLLAGPAVAVAGDPCTDEDGDLVCDAADNCPDVANADQSDIDGDGRGDLCDTCIADPLDDQDGDGVCGNLDRCPHTKPDDEPLTKLRYYLGPDEHHFHNRKFGEAKWTIEDTGGCSCKQLKNRLEAGSAYIGDHFVGCTGEDMKLWARIIRRTACEPICEDRTCGFDGCNGLCGACEGDEECLGGACQVPDPCDRVIDCDDGDLCTVDDCEPGVGCVHAPAAAGAPCDDANACTGGDRCVGGRCVGDPLDLCAVADGCTTWSCDPVSGPVEEALPDGTACDPAPGDICVAGACQDGVCLTAPGLSCDDENACTTDDCDPAAGCVHGQVECSDDDACTDDGCDPVTGCTTSPRDCDDGDACTSDGCDPDSGCAHAPRSCDDGDGCTHDLCDPAVGCVYEPAPLCGSESCCEPHPTPSCDQPDVAACVCDLEPSCCDLEWHPICMVLAMDECGLDCGAGCDPVACEDGDPCTVDGCDPLGDCFHQPDPACACPGGCDDGDPCTNDACGPLGCVHEPEPACACPGGCDDGDDCTNDFCDVFGGACVHLPNPECVCPGGCDDGEVCTNDFCDPAVGCVNEPDPLCGSESCCEPHPTPGCDQPDVAACVCDLEPSCCDLEWHPICADLARFDCGLDCGAGCDPAACEDGDPCTVDGCDPLGDCFHQPDPACACPGGCDDGDPCTNDACGPLGCVHEPEPACACPGGCDDGDDCTHDFCDVFAGACGHTPNPECVCPGGCVDGEACTFDWCDVGAGGCRHDADPGCEPDSDCCTAHEWPLCESPFVTECVCAMLPECCDDAWGPACADAAVECGVECGACEPTPEVCDGRDNDCDGVVDGPGVCLCDGVLCDDGDPCTHEWCEPATGVCRYETAPECACPGGCDDGEVCTYDWCEVTTAECRHEPEPGCEPDSDCCVAHEWGWCASPSISECVCDQAQDCCDDQWAPHCVDLAVACGLECGACEPTPEVCDGLDNDCDGVVDGPGVCLCDGVVCDDGDPCTHEWCEPATGACRYETAPECACPGGCDDGEVCTYDWCEVTTAECRHEPEPGCEPDSDCCVAHDWGWCASPSISECVCDQAQDCCDDQWAPHCVDLAVACGLECGACEPTPEVCDGRDNDCDGVVDGPGVCLCDDVDCDDGDDCTYDWCEPSTGGCNHQTTAECACPGGCDDGQVCTFDYCDPAAGCRHEPEPGCEPGSDCCVAHAWPGCASPNVTACVCDLSPDCCEGEWSAHCAELAVGCGVECDACEPSEEICDGFDNDCDGVADGPGVCDCDPAACDDGDPCTEDECGASGACRHTPIAGCVPEVSCCEPHGSPGCESPEITACVCDRNPECCDEQWFPHCTWVAESECGLDCGGGCVPSPEVCDGLDNDCDGYIDEEGCECEPTLCPPGACDDGVPCTQDLCDPNTGECVHLAVAGCCVPSPEVCDGLDNDCDGEIDGPGVCDCDPAACDDGDPCTEDHCDPAAGGCLNEPIPGCCFPTPEVCDGLDNDCDGEIDGPGVCDCDPAACDDGDPCTDGHCDPTGACVFEPIPGCCFPTPEVCDGLDNDCDGVIDGPSVCTSSCTTNGAACDDGDPCTEGDRCFFGICAGPAVSCNDDDPCTNDSCAVTSGQCVHTPNPACDCAAACDDGNDCTEDGCSPLSGACTHVHIDGCCEPGETCGDGLDNDCDGIPDNPEVCDCAAAEICGDGVDNDCDGIPDNPELCDCSTHENCGDGLDNDCNGVVDDPAVCECLAGEVCGDGIDNDCDGIPDNPELCDCLPAAEVCDGVDNDCDALVDEDLPSEGPCDSSDADQCQNGSWVCVSGAYSCIGDSPLFEVCDGLDNDCNGFIDELPECDGP